MIHEVGQSHPGSVIVTDILLSALHSDPRFQVEFYWENIDAIYHPDQLKEQRDSIIRQYRHHKLDLLVLVGPDSIRLLEDPDNAFFPDVPVVICCSAPGQVDLVTRHPQLTGSWFQLEPARTVQAALRLLPETRHIFVVGGQSDYDRRLTALVKASLLSDKSNIEVTYLTDLPMSQLQEKLQHLQRQSIVIYLTFYKDAQGREFLSATEALSMIVAASNAPVFGISETYLGRGIVGGFVVSVEEQAKITARDALEILAGKSAQEIPIETGPSAYKFDWRELRRWKMDERRLPAGSTILFPQATLWEQHKKTLLIGLPIIVGLSLVSIYLLYEQRQLKRARAEQAQLSGMLINAQEEERSRLAAEIHDDFSQKLAVLSLGLEMAAEGIPESLTETNEQLQELINTASELGADLHTLSHRLHSSTLTRLGLVAGLGSLCKEFTAQQATPVAFSHDDIPRSVSPPVALCLFRLVQEGLRNVQKHSGAAKVQVRLENLDGMLHLSLLDNGRGFNVKNISEKPGLGLWSMRERVRLVNGRFEIHSENQKGTRIEVWVRGNVNTDSAQSGSASPASAVAASRSVG